MVSATLADLVVAYRKAKVDLYYSSDPRLLDLLAYEESLEYNLTALLSRLNAEDEEWVRDPEFVGTFSFAPKSVQKPPVASDGFHSSDLRTEWAFGVARRAGGQPKAEFRVMARCSIDMHVLSTYWMIRVGEVLESRLGPEAAGSRLKRVRTGELNLRAPGSFQHYFEPYRRWRDRGIAAMSEALDAGERVVALTADVSSFYHRLDPSFLLDRRFLREVLEVRLNSSDRKLHRLFILGLQAWTASVAEAGGWLAQGIPVGLPASAVVANLALFELDRVALEELNPIYYGRYVDDIILVLSDGPDFDSQEAIWDWIITRSRGHLVASGGRGDEAGVSVRYTADYLASSKVVFGNGKNKTFKLSGESGQALVGSIRRTIDESASEWRSFAEISSDPANVSTDLMLATRSDGDKAANLREADQVSTRRAAFAIRLRDFEAYERDLDLESWATQRAAFFSAVARNVITLPKFFELASYLPRLVKLAASCGDRAALTSLFAAVRTLYLDTIESCELTVKAYREQGSEGHAIASVWGQQLVRECVESLASGMADNLSRPDLDAILQPLREIDRRQVVGFGSRRLRDIHSRLFSRDLAHRPYRFALLDSEYAPKRGVPSELNIADGSVGWAPLEDDVVDGLDSLADSLRSASADARPRGSGATRGRAVAGLVFSTRPPSAWELFLALRGRGEAKFGFASATTIQTILGAMRGYVRLADLPAIAPSADGYPTLNIASNVLGGRVRIALAMLQTHPNECIAAAVGQPRLDRFRYEQLKRLFNEVVGRPGKPQYVLLPELSLPSRWFIPFAGRLRREGINLIAGVEYLQGPVGIVHNQVWAALETSGGGGLPFIVYPQDKQNPAPGEERELFDHAGLTVQPKVAWKTPQPPVIAHGDFRFAILVCSELTNIAYRSSLRGRVDALLVPEWNRDLATFGALVDSAALDIHTYVVQVNNRTYGDTRIRAPRMREWERDVVRLRGGAHNFSVIGEIDSFLLREFQSAHRRPDGLFKPVPDGFEIAPERWRVPRIGKIKES